MVVPCRYESGLSLQVKPCERPSSPPPPSLCPKDTSHTVLASHDESLSAVKHAACGMAALEQ